MTCEELLTLPLADRIKWLRSKDGPKGAMSHDKLAAELGTSRQTVISWEKGTEPKKLIARLVAFSGCPPETWRRHEAEATSAESIDLRLRALEASIVAGGKETTRAIRALTRAIERLERRLEGGAPPASSETTR